jgi:ABC-type anion transport system duplicated permease subunit
MNKSPQTVTRQHRATDLFVSVEEVLAPILVVVFAAIVGGFFLHAFPGKIAEMAMKASHYSYLHHGSRIRT